MPFAITLRFDVDSAATIEVMWQTLADHGIDTDRQQVGYPAHITLAVYPDGTPTDMLRAAVARTAADWRALPVTLSAFGIFPAPSAILWVAPVVRPELLGWHASLQAALPELHVDPHYRPDTWVPHVTLSGPISDPSRPLAVLLPLWRPLSCLLDRVDLVRFRPVEVLQTHTLS